MARARQVKIRDVAQTAGVSITAVSHALNNKGTLSEATRERIKSVAERMGYQADALARGLRRSPLGAIGIVLRSLDSLGEYHVPGVDVFQRTVGVLSAKALERGLAPMLVPDLTGRSIPTISFMLDGYVVLNPHLGDPVIELLRNRGIPYVTQGADPQRPEFTAWASEDDTASALAVLDHFAAEGARAPVLVRGTDQNAWNLDSEAAYTGWCRRHGAQPRTYAVPEGAGVQGGLDVVERIAGDGVPDAVYALTGRHAAGVLAGLQARGLHVPGDVLLATGSDSEHARHARPPISAIQFDPESTCNDLLDLLQSRIAGENPDSIRRTATRLRIRSSSRRGDG
ncbi:LacI family DNA-binding transcriptional regulator [Zhihengliuella halotolerans]|uniref:LacI family DNA-binding transcriptional regulator n=1 Tax=Zhihengliuella halotolerans TaxID=370736 RepID=UPI000C7FA127|nr:LacI family DNA-binding transcriptional regulator [Zhihengliuella halotolerans]